MMQRFDRSETDNKQWDQDLSLLFEYLRDDRDLFFFYQFIYLFILKKIIEYISA